MRKIILLFIAVCCLSQTNAVFAAQTTTVNTSIARLIVDRDDKEEKVFTKIADTLSYLVDFYSDDKEISDFYSQVLVSLCDEFGYNETGKYFDLTVANEVLAKYGLVYIGTAK